MSGCLGGIGRSITKWMMKRGAKKFAMIGRSGLDKEPARLLVRDLEDAGAYVHVTRGDVGDAEVVEEAVTAIEGEIGGVVQAAMGLDVCSFPAQSPVLSLLCSLSLSLSPISSFPLSQSCYHHAYPAMHNRKLSGLPCLINPGTPP